MCTDVSKVRRELSKYGTLIFMEGPSLVILNEELMPFQGKKVLRVSGNTKQPKELLEGSTLEEIDTWGKVLFLIFSPANKKASKEVVKIHFLLFGSYRINEPRENMSPRLELKFNKGVIYFYSCSIQFFADEYYKKLDREVDLLSPEWSDTHVLELMKAEEETFLCDLFLDQSLFAGSGNIVKNEVLFNLRRHPLTKLSMVAKEDWPLLLEGVRDYCFHFYEWKKKFELKSHWQVYRKSTCPICGRKLNRKKLGKFMRVTFHCPHCQRLSLSSKKLKLFPVLEVERDKIIEERIDH